MKCVVLQVPKCLFRVRAIVSNGCFMTGLIIMLVRFISDIGSLSISGSKESKNGNYFEICIFQ